MKIARCRLKSVSPYSQSKHYDVPLKSKETKGDYEERTWRERCNVDDSGHIVISPMAFANSLKSAAKYLGMKVPEKKGALYTKYFAAGVLVTEGITLPIKKDDVPGEWLFLPSDGQRGGGKRVMRCFPLIREWAGEVTFYVLDDIITEPIFRQTLDYAGNIIGIGRFRPESQGYYGRFTVDQFSWTEE
jgi:hypothetical protein